MKKESKVSVNKNTVILIISALLILVSIAIAVFALKGNDIAKKDNSAKKPAVTDKAEAGSKKSDKKSGKDSKAESDKTGTDTAEEPADGTDDSSSEGSSSDKPYVFAPGKYKIATKEDPLGLRLEPNTDSNRLLYIDKGEEVEIIAVWDDWGFTVYNGSGGWLSMNYLEAVSGSTESDSANSSAEE